MPGVPRANYMPYPFQIIQSPKGVLMVYEFASANRFVNMGKPQEAGSDTWMGTNNGHWEGETLVIDVTGLNGLAWFDRAGDFASNQLHVVERYTRVDPYHINYEATIEDPSVFTGPGRSACRCINWWTRTLSSWISSALSSRKSCFTEQFKKQTSSTK